MARLHDPRSLWFPTGCALLTVATMATIVSTPPKAAYAQVSLLPDEVERVDVIAIERDGRELFSFDAITGQRAGIRLEPTEEVLFEGSRGRVGVVLTNRRALGVTVGGSWREERVGVQEVPATTALVEDRLAILATNRRVLAFVASGASASSGWVEEGFSPSEEAVAIRAGAAVAVAVTNRHALGIAPGLTRFQSESMRVREQIESVRAQDTLLTIRTDLRILVFSGPRALWTIQRLNVD